MMNSECVLARLLRFLGRHLVAWGSSTADPVPAIDFRWNDPQNEEEAVDFLVARMKATAKKNDFSAIALVGPSSRFSKEVHERLSFDFSVRRFDSAMDIARLPDEERNRLVVTIASSKAKAIHEVALALLSDERTRNLPFEYAVTPKQENKGINHMWEDSVDFISPLHAQPVDCLTLFQESLENFDPKTGIRDFLDLEQCVNQIVANNLPGDIAEFGSFKGQSGYLLGRYLEEIGCDKRLFLFDMFESFPRESIGIDHFWSETHEVDYEEVKSKFSELQNVKLVKGDFTQTFPKSECGSLSLAFVDCDSYRGTKYLIEEIFDNRLATGGLMIFEDYGHAGLLGNRLAVHEAFDNKAGAFCFFSQFSGSFIVCKSGIGQS